MKAKYDIDKVELSAAFINALKKVLAAEIKMMQEHWPEDADMWHWGRASVGDLANANSVNFYYGAEEDMPDDGLGRFAVIVAE